MQECKIHLNTYLPNTIKRTVHCNSPQSDADIILKYTSAVQNLNVQCIASKSRLMCIAHCAAQQELTTATYLTAMKPATVGDTTQHYRGKKTELGLLYLCLKMSSKDREERRDIWG